MGFMDKFKEKASSAANSAKNAASSAKTKYEEKKETMAAEKAERERVRAEKQAEADSATQEMLGKMNEVNGTLFEIDSKQLLAFTADFYDKLYLPAHSVSNSKLIFHPLDKKIDKSAQKEFSEYNPSNEQPVLMILGKHHQCVFLSTKALYFKKAFDEECIYCGYTIRRVSHQEHMPTPLAPNGCKSNPSGKKFAPHVMVKTS